MKPIPEILMQRVINLIGSEVRQALEDYGVDVEITNNDPDFTDSIRQLSEAVIESVRLFDTKETKSDG